MAASEGRSASLAVLMAIGREAEPAPAENEETQVTNHRFLIFKQSKTTVLRLDKIKEEKIN